MLAVALVPHGIATAGGASANPFCQRIANHQIAASSGAYMYCLGPQAGSGGSHSPVIRSYGNNVDAANIHEDVTPSGVRGYGQSETSIASTGSYVVEEWNDSTGFFAPCPSPMNKEELSGYGFSNNGGTSFTDQGGVPNSNCSAFRAGGDPSVEAWQTGGSSYFYMSSLYNSTTGTGPSFVALTACKVNGSGSSAHLGCSQPIRAAQSSECTKFGSFTFCNFLDKEFLTLDPQRGRLYISYTEFGSSPTGKAKAGQIELATCDIGTPSGGTGPSGGTAATPVCTQPVSSGNTAPPYLVIAPGGVCENEGAYPAVDERTGDVYVAYEYNWATNFESPACEGNPTRDVVNRIPHSCLTNTSPSTCSGPFTNTSVFVTSMDTAFVPGYNRFPANDFPRIAVSEHKGTVSVVWNDTRNNPAGDILLKSFSLGGLAPLQTFPVQVNTDRCSGGSTCHFHFLPGVRYANGDGNLDVSWYDGRLRSPHSSSGLMDVYAATEVDPTASTTPASNTRVTDVSSDWFSTSSDIVPNFGDYTDNYISELPSTGPSYRGMNDFVAWSDGRLQVPQPFAAKAATG